MIREWRQVSCRAKRGAAWFWTSLRLRSVSSLKSRDIRDGPPVDVSEPPAIGPSPANDLRTTAHAYGSVDTSGHGLATMDRWLTSSSRWLAVSTRQEPAYAANMHGSLNPADLKVAR